MHRDDIVIYEVVDKIHPGVLSLMKKNGCKFEQEGKQLVWTWVDEHDRSVPYGASCGLGCNSAWYDLVFTASRDVISVRIEDAMTEPYRRLIGAKIKSHGE